MYGRVSTKSEIVGFLQGNGKMSDVDVNILISEANNRMFYCVDC